MDENLYNFIDKRISRRSFLEKPINKIISNKLNIYIDKRNTPNTNIIFCNGSCAEIFKGMVGSYGKIQNPAGYLIVSGNNMAEAGYVGELVLLYALSLGLSSCWVSGTYDRNRIVRMKNEEMKVYAVIALGYAKDIMRFETIIKSFTGSYRRKKVDHLLVNGNLESLDEMSRDVFKKASIAPSARNRQPWVFHYENGQYRVSAKQNKEKYMLDVGICASHIKIVLDYYDAEYSITFNKSDIIFQLN